MSRMEANCQKYAKNDSKIVKVQYESKMVKNVPYCRAFGTCAYN